MSMMDLTPCEKRGYSGPGYCGECDWCKPMIPWRAQQVVDRLFDEMFNTRTPDAAPLPKAIARFKK